MTSVSYAPTDMSHAPIDRHTLPATGASRVLIVGTGAVGQHLAASLEAAGKHIVVGFVDNDNFVDKADDDVETIKSANVKPKSGNAVTVNSEHWPILGRRHSMASIVQEHAIDEVIIAYAPTWQQQLVEQMTAACPNVALSIVPTSFEALLSVERITGYGDIALVPLTTRAHASTELVKRAFDLTVAVLVLGLFAPVWALIALLIKLTSPGPVIFAQERIGLHNRVFRVFKFRTMRQDAEVATGPVLSEGEADSRLTSVGRYLRRFRIDEVPQFLNVLRGEMSLVGPRPERPVFVTRYCEMVPTYARRHDVRPGITGLAQVYGGYHTDGRDKLRFDLIYASHQSVWFDLQILLRTIRVIVMPDDKH